MFPHTVTLYNVVTEPDPNDITREHTTNYITILEGVLLDASKAVNVRASGLDSADAVNLYIPYNVKATDGLTGETKEYANSMTFWSAPDKSKMWTLKPGVNSFFVKGVVVDEKATFESISLQNSNTYNITKVDDKDFGNLKHFEVGAN